MSRAGEARERFPRRQEARVLRVGHDDGNFVAPRAEPVGPVCPHMRACSTGACDNMPPLQPPRPLIPSSSSISRQSPHALLAMRIRETRGQ